VVYGLRLLPEIASKPLRVEVYLMVATSAHELGKFNPDAYIWPGYRLAIEKAHVEALLDLALDRLSAGSIGFAETMLRRGGETCYLRSEDARCSTSDEGRFVVQGALVLHLSWQYSQGSGTRS
jgi:hypothetical protein